MSLPLWLSNLAGTALSYFRIGMTGPRLKNDGSGNLQVRNAADSGNVSVQSSSLILPNSGGNTNTLQTGGSQAANFTITLPLTAGSSGQAITTDGSGNWTYTTINTTASIMVETTTVAFGSSSPITQFTLPANAIVENVLVMVDTAFNGTNPSLTVGISGTTSKYMGSGDSDLTTQGVYEVTPGLAADVSTEALIITYAAGTSTAGSARVEVHYTIPTH